MPFEQVQIVLCSVDCGFRRDVRGNFTMNANKVDSFMSWVALLYVVALVLALPLHGALRLTEILAPLMAWQCFRRRAELQSVLRKMPLAPLALAWCWMILATAVHCLQRTGGCYDLAVFGCMGLVFLFFRLTPLPSRQVCGWTAAALLGVVFAGYLLTKCISVQGTCLEGLLYCDRHFAQLDPNVLVTRYQFLFDNPNLLGGSFILPVLLALPVLEKRLSQASWKGFAIIAVLTFLGVLPLLATASKLSVMTFGLLAGTFAVSTLLAPLKPRVLATIAIVAFGTLCLTTVWFRTYPAIRQSPWVDFQHRGNYSVHQEIYGRILLDGGAGGLLFGYGAADLHRLYPEYGDREKILGILKPYGFESELECFCTFMDPHCEYLNTASFFGVPALLGILAFIFLLMRQAFQKRDLAALLFLAGVLFSCFWEDVGSKRYLWCALGIVAGRLAEPQNMRE